MLWERIKNEPALAIGAVQGLLTVLVAFGLPLTEAQIVGVLTFSGALLALLTRQLVTPVSKLPLVAVGTASNQPPVVPPPPPRPDDTPPTAA